MILWNHQSQIQMKALFFLLFVTIVFASKGPSQSPTNSPTSSIPTKSPSHLPSRNPTVVPTHSPSLLPTLAPTHLPIILFADTQVHQGAFHPSLRCLTRPDLLCSSTAPFFQTFVPNDTTVPVTTDYGFVIASNWYQLSDITLITSTPFWYGGTNDCAGWTSTGWHSCVHGGYALPQNISQVYQDFCDISNSLVCVCIR